MEHEQPLFDLLMAIAPDDDKPGNTTFAGWTKFITSHKDSYSLETCPEIWEQINIPPELQELTNDTQISFGKLNYNISLLEAVGITGGDYFKYDGSFFAAIYRPSEVDASVFIWAAGIILAVGEDCEKAMHKTLALISNARLNMGPESTMSLDNAFSEYRSCTTVKEVIE